MTTAEALRQFQPETRDENWIRPADITETELVTESSAATFDEEQPTVSFCPLNEW